MKLTEQQIQNIAFALERLRTLDIKPALRVLVARNLLVFKPLAETQREAYPMPTHADPTTPTLEEIAAVKAWEKGLEERTTEVQVHMIPFIPEFDDTLYPLELKGLRDQGRNTLTDEGIRLSGNQRNQVLMEILLPLIQDA